MTVRPCTCSASLRSTIHHPHCSIDPAQSVPFTRCTHQFATGPPVDLLRQLHLPHHRNLPRPVATPRCEFAPVSHLRDSLSQSATAMTNLASEGDQHPPLDLARITRAWRAFRAYRRLSLQVFDSQALAFEHLPEDAKTLIPDVPIRLSHAAEAIEHNADVIERIAALAGITKPFQLDALDPDDLAQTVADFPDVVDGLIAITRDWSAVSEKDRSLSYDHILRAIEKAADEAVSAGTLESRDTFSVLVPGASLGRLAWEIANRGFVVQGVESSYLQLFMCNYIMNGSATPEAPLHLYPYAHHTGMAPSVNDQCKEVEFPDTNPRQLQNPNFSMVAGEFLELYNKEDAWDCVATCFFVENSHSIVSYVRRIATILKSGGVWINHGSLDFRFDDSETEPSVEVTAEELELVIQRAGMRIIRKEMLICKPPFAVSGMINEEYKSIFTVATRI